MPLGYTPPTKGMISVSIDARRVTNMMTKLQVKLPEVPREIQKEFGGTLVRRLRESLDRKGLRFSGYLWSHIKWNQKKDNGYLTMPLYGGYLDSARPHWVSFKRRTRLRSWAMAKGNLNIQLQLQRGKKGAIFVRPHPWIEQPTFQTIKDLPSMSKIVLDRKIKEAAK